MLNYFYIPLKHVLQDCFLQIGLTLAFSTTLNLLMAFMAIRFS